MARCALPRTTRRDATRARARAEATEDIIARLLAQADAAPLLESEIKALDAKITTTQQHMVGIEALKKTYESSKDKEAVEVVVKQIEDNKEKIADLEAQKAQFVAALKKLNGDAGDAEKKRQAKVRRAAHASERKRAHTHTHTRTRIRRRQTWAQRRFCLITKASRRPS